ncbi:MAG: type II toxin-antitoxin system VapC family toxin [Leptolyngbyaceae cyanobacterium SL_7_1]|nr:type II toxin-antitoxin system VapC family toxin [Leptolyngbyaceae cyanobacterium SL_7_1]
MKLLFDTSVIVAASLPKHPGHTPCFDQLQAAKAKRIQGYFSTHSVAEFYSVMTRMPSQPRMSPKEAWTLIKQYLHYLNAIPLEVADYLEAVAQMSILNIPGGGIFDALIAQAAFKVGVDRILTLNPNHFNRLSDEIAQIIEVPK